VPEGATPYVASGDVSNAFYRLAVPDELGGLFTLPCVDASLVGFPDTPYGISKAGELLLPVLTVLPMGWSWSVFFCQSVVENAVRAEVGDFIIQDKSPGLVLKHPKDLKAPAHAATLIGAAYGDIFLVEGLDPVEVNNANGRIQNRLTQAGLLVHEIEEASTSSEFIGLAFDHGKVSVRPKKFWKVKLALEGLLKRGQCSGEMLEVLLGHLVWVMLAKRGSLSLFCVPVMPLFKLSILMLLSCGPPLRGRFARLLHLCRYSDLLSRHLGALLFQLRMLAPRGLEL
jgi:hypothetical protein